RSLEVELSTLLDQRCELRVSDGATGAALPGVDVTLDDLPAGRLTTDADGRAEFATAEWRNDVVRLEKEGYGTAVQRLVQVSTPAEPHEIRLLRTATLEARVTDVSGRPLERVSVVLHGDRRGRTDIDGRCTITDLSARTELGIELRKPGVFKRDEFEPILLE